MRAASSESCTSIAVRTGPKISSWATRTSLLGAARIVGSMKNPPFRPGSCGRPQDPGLYGGFFIEPTILAAPSNDVRVAQEEIFGPVLTAIEVQDSDEAARIANATPYGLSATVWTRDIDKAMDLAARIRSGQVYVNTATG